MTRLLSWACLAATAAAAEPDLSRTLKSVEDRYNRARTLQVAFQQTYTTPGRGSRTESGDLFLRKPGRMRWQYRDPAGKLFVSDGKHVYYYNPAANRVEKMKLKETDDMRAPLAFLLGRLDFKRDFSRFESRVEGEDLQVTAYPKLVKLPYQRVEFLVTPGSEIRRLAVTGQDNSVLSFRFEGEKVNPPLDDGMFKFKAPPGAELVDSTQSGDQ